MKKKQIMSVAMALIVGLGIGSPIVNYVYATISKNIDVITGVDIEVNGEKFIAKDANGKEVEAFVHNGTTYVPIRAISTIYKSDIDWDKKRKTVIIKTNDENMSKQHNQNTISASDKLNIIFDDIIEIAEKNAKDESIKAFIEENAKHFEGYYELVKLCKLHPDLIKDVLKNEQDDIKISLIEKAKKENLFLYTDDGAIYCDTKFDKDRKLSKEEIEDINNAFAVFVYLYDEKERAIMHGAGNESKKSKLNTMCHLFSSYYEKPEEIHIGDFVYYMKREFDIDEKEFAALKELDGFIYKNVEKIEDTITPVGRVPKQTAAKLFNNATGVDFEKALENSHTNDKSGRKPVYLGEPYNAFYSWASDFGAGMFEARSGNIEGDKLTLQSTKATLVLKQEDNRLYILSHRKNIEN